MGKIKDYINQNPVLTGDKVIGSAASNGETKNFTVDALATFVETTLPDNVSKIIAGTNITITPTTGIGDVTISATSGGSYTLPIASGSTLGGVKVGSGLSIDGSGVLSSTYSNLQKVITATYTLTDADNDYTVFIDNGASAITISLGAITIPNFSVGFIQEGSADVTFSGAGLSNPVGLKCLGQGYQTFIERKLSTSTYYLLGNTKV